MGARNTARRCVRGWVLVLTLGSPEIASAGLGTWTTGRPDGGTVHALAIDPATPITLYVATGGGVFKSVDAGDTWATTNKGLTSLYVNAIAIDSATPSTLYVGRARSGVFRSTDSGATWVAVNRGLANPGVHALALDSSRPPTLYAGLREGSVWQSTPPTAVESNLTITLSDSPDPVTGTTPLTYTIAVTNGGPDPATSLSVSQALPAGVVFNSAAGSGWSCGESGGVVSCTRPGLAVGSAPAISVRVTPEPAAAALVSSASVSAAEADPNPADNSANQTTTVNQALVWLGTRTKTVQSASSGFFLKGEVTYTITLTNDGTQIQGDNPGPEFEDALPTSLGLVSVNATSGTVTIDFVRTRFAWDGSISSGGTVTITIIATINPDVALGTTVANQGTANYDADGNATNEAVVTTDDPGQPGANDPTSFVVVSPPLALYTIPPCRLLDTRDPNGPFGHVPLFAFSRRRVGVVGLCGIPPTARAISANMTVTQSTHDGNLRVFAADGPFPDASSINYTTGQTRANNAVITLSGFGDLDAYCAQPSGTAELILDVNGYFE
jgi:uncharacterized repeat protein (TIGR01451 family)